MEFGTANFYCLQCSPNPKQIIFINQGNDRILDDFFEREHEKVVAFFQQHGYDFIFLPKILTTDFLHEILTYNRPDLARKKSRMR